MTKQVLILVLVLVATFLLPWHLIEAQTLPICLNPQGHLIWSSAPVPGAIPVAVTTAGFSRDLLMPSTLNWLGQIFTVPGTLKLTASQQPQVPANDPNGYIYFDKTDNVFKCYQKDPKDGKVKWIDCRGEIIGGGDLTGSGTKDRLSKWTDAKVLGLSRIEELPDGVRFYDSNNKPTLEITW